MCAEIVKDAILAHGKPGIMNIDQGSQFTSEIYTEMLKNNGIRIIMDGKSRAIDNVFFIERLWRTIKYEPIYVHAYEDGLAAVQRITPLFFITVKGSTNH